MKVLKFGGTSVGSAERIRHVASLVSERGKNIIVLSAMSGTTNSLVEISEYLYKKNINGAKETINILESKYLKTIASLYDKHESREKALKEIKACFNYIRSFTSRENFTEIEEKIILAQGEIMSVAMMTILLNERGLYAESLPALDFMKTGQQGEPDTQHIQLHLQALLDKYMDADIYVTQGFICRNATGEIDNLQRGGSDYTASLIGAAIEADEIEIWTDIDGMHNNDPRYVEKTDPVSELHYEEAAELAYFGAKILHPTCVLPAKVNNIPVRLLNTMEPEAHGTLIYNNITELERGVNKMADHEEYYEPDILSVSDENGNEILFELLERYETDEDVYVAITRYYETDEEIIDGDYEVIILKVENDNGEEYLAEIEDELEYEQVSDILMAKVEEKFEVEYFEPEQ